MNLNSNNLYLFANIDRIVFLKNIIQNPNIIVGDWTYYDDPVNVLNFKQNVLYHHDFIGDKLIIGNFCQIATAVKFIMGGASHDLSGFSSFPFVTFNQYWPEIPVAHVSKKDTVIENDVWIGYDALIMPGITIGNGAIVGSRAVVTKDVEPYAIVVGNPARVIRKRFDDDTIDMLLQLQWWNWPIDKIRIHVLDIMSGDKAKLAQLLTI